MILYRFIECIIYHLLLVGIVLLVKLLKIVQKLNGLYNSTIILSSAVEPYPSNL